MRLRLVLVGLDLANAIAFDVHLKDDDMVCQPIQKRPGQAFRPECFGPFVDGQVAGD